MDKRIVRACLEALPIAPAEARRAVDGIMSYAGERGEGMAIAAYLPRKGVAEDVGLSYREWADLDELNAGLAEWWGAESLCMVAFDLKEGRIYAKRDGSLKAFEV